MLAIFLIGIETTIATFLPPGARARRAATTLALSLQAHFSPNTFAESFLAFTICCLRRTLTSGCLADAVKDSMQAVRGSLKLFVAAKNIAWNIISLLVVFNRKVLER